LESLVHHQWSVPYDTPFDAVHQLFREHNVDLLALICDGRVAGLCSRGQARIPRKRWVLGEHRIPASEFAAVLPGGQQ
jgi:hypothetical protein